MEQKPSSVQKARQNKPKNVAQPNVYAVAEEAAHGNNYYGEDAFNQRGRVRSRSRGVGRGDVVTGRGRGGRSNTDGGITTKPLGRGRGVGGTGASSSTSWADIVDNPTEEEEEVLIEEPIYSLKVKELRPGTTGHTLTVKVINSNPISTEGAIPVAECLVGDDSAVILFTARGSQVHVMKPGTTVVLRNARVTVFRGSLRLSVDRLQLGTQNANLNTNPNPNPKPKPIQLVKLSPDRDFNVNADNNLSVIEFEVIPLDSLIYQQF